MRFRLFQYGQIADRSFASDQQVVFSRNRNWPFSPPVDDKRTIFEVTCASDIRDPSKTFGVLLGCQISSRQQAYGLSEVDPRPASGQAKHLFVNGDSWKLFLLPDFAFLFELLAFGFDGFEEFGGGAVFGELLRELAADGGLQDRSFDCFGELAV